MRIKKKPFFKLKSHRRVSAKASALAAGLTVARWRNSICISGESFGLTHKSLAETRLGSELIIQNLIFRCNSLMKLDEHMFLQNAVKAPHRYAVHGSDTRMMPMAASLLGQ